MKKIADVAGRELQWSQKSATKMEYELRADDQIVAAVRFRSMFGTFATGESGDGCWTFKRVGFWQSRMTVRPCDADTEVASFKRNTWTGGGSLVLANGGEYRATTNFWSTNFEIKNAADERLLRLDYGGVFHLSARVLIEPKAVSLPELPLLVLSSWYLVVMLHMDAAGAAAGAAAAS